MRQAKGMRLAMKAPTTSAGYIVVVEGLMQGLVSKMVTMVMTAVSGAPFTQSQAAGARLSPMRATKPPMTSWFDNLADSIHDGGAITEEQAVAMLATPDRELLALVAAGARLRRKHFGMTVKLNYLVNLKSGLCPESCSYCSQALGSAAPILKYSWLKTEEAVKQADIGIRGGASRVCLVASGRGPGNRDVERVSDIVTRLEDGQAESLEEVGVDAYNHNINTAESFHDTIVKSHTYADRTNTVAKAKAAGLSPCSGLIVGLGESDEQVVEALFALRELDSESIPINFLVPFDGTPMEGQWNLTPAHCLQNVITARFVCPDREIRLAGGREIHFRSLQAQALHVANSIFLGDYLTAEGQAAEDDIALIRDNGLTIIGHENDPDASRTPMIRTRGAGTAQGANV